MDPALGALALARAQRRIIAANRFGIPARRPRGVPGRLHRLAGDRLPGPAVLGRHLRPRAGARRWRRRIGDDLRSVGVHQGLAPVLDVVRDLRWGRVEETIGEDPYLVGTIGTAYVRGLESAGIVATLKHFAGYSASAGARNLAPVRAGVRELADVMLPPFEMALREGGARSVMPAYTDTDGVPAAADQQLLTGLLRDSWGFTGTVVSDYFGIAFLETPARGGRRAAAEAAAHALAAGIDVELPTAASATASRCVDAVRAGDVPEALVDRAAAPGAARRSASSACSTTDWRPGAGRPTADRPGLGRRTGRWPAGSPRSRSSCWPTTACCRWPRTPGSRWSARAPTTRWRCSAATRSPRTSLAQHPERAGRAWTSRPLLEALRAELPDAKVDVRAGLRRRTARTRPASRRRCARAAEADVCVAVLGDRAGPVRPGHLRRGLRRGRPRACPVCRASCWTRCSPPAPRWSLVLLAGRPYALGRWHGPARPASCRRSSPGEEGGPAVAGVLSGRVDPVRPAAGERAARPGGQPWTYLAAAAGPARRGQQPRPDAAVPVRPRPVVHLVRLGGRRRTVPEPRSAPTVVRRLGDRPQHR